MPRLLALLFVCAAAAGCASTAGPDAGTVDSEDSLLAYLTDRGYLLVPDGLPPSVVPTAVSRRYRLEGNPQEAEIAVYEFETDADAERGLQTLRTEIRPRSNRELFAGGRLVVLYQGSPYENDGAGLQLALSRVLGRSELL